MATKSNIRFTKGACSAGGQSLSGEMLRCPLQASTKQLVVIGGQLEPAGKTAGHFVAQLGYRI